MTLQNCLTFVLLRFCKCSLKALACTWTMFNHGFNVELFATLIMPSHYVFQSMSQMHNPRVILLLLTSKVDEHYLNEDSTQCFSSALWCERGKRGRRNAFLFNLGLLSSNKEIILSEQPFLYSNGGAAPESRSVSWYDKGIKNISVSLFFGPSSPYFRMFLSFVSVLKHKCTLEKKCLLSLCDLQRGRSNKEHLMVIILCFLALTLKMVLFLR